ncbi:MAG: DNA alkylation repair protein [Prevotella sp.]|nr:DNA alkylation repair protein [Prevotella sp.]MBP7098568.1 DNA alkylation repair protein [Prevotella sp.]MBP8686624.1 DNA alkylation repair protein [Prevotella sp.]MBP9982662.1 DNA alkylation repair protein [Prevotella sp.]MCI1731610.1 DNA alkylation repair protein [Prevotella sp.]
MNMETNDKLKNIKQSFRLVMNGPASQSMREKGLNYKINWGVPFTTLRDMAAEYGKDYDLAIALFKENIRECKILATMIMPVDKFEADLADLWMEQTDNQELAEMLAFNLLQYTSYAPAIAYKWIATDNNIYQICGYSILSRLFMNGQELNDRGMDEYLDQAAAALRGDNIGLKHAALNSIMRFMELGETFEKAARVTLKDIIEI